MTWYEILLRLPSSAGHATAWFLGVGLIGSFLAPLLLAAFGPHNENETKLFWFLTGLFWGILACSLTIAWFLAKGAI